MPATISNPTPRPFAQPLSFLPAIKTPELPQKTAPGEQAITLGLVWRVLRAFLHKVCDISIPPAPLQGPAKLVATPRNVKHRRTCATLQHFTHAAPALAPHLLIPSGLYARPARPIRQFHCSVSIETFATARRRIHKTPARILLTSDYKRSTFPTTLVVTTRLRGTNARDTANLRRRVGSDESCLGGR